METQGLKELYIDELKDIYSAETQLVRRCPSWPKRRRLKNLATDLRSIWNRPKATSSALNRFSANWRETDREEVQGYGRADRGRQRDDGRGRSGR